jgi:uncharacterized protein YjbI with pentapeptide repeats
MAGPDTNNTESPYPIWGFGPPSSEPDTKKLDALLASLNGSAERFQTLWFSFLGLTLYLAIAALATTHRDLLLNNPQTLPILNIKVELLPFYVIAPLLYLVFHFYLLMMLALLARTAAEFDKQLRTTLSGEPERERYRAQVGNALFLQLLVGMKGERAGVNALLMGLIALITIVLAPLATLVLMQMMFLPYHHLRITWWHRGIVVADLVLIVVMTYRCFFPRGVRKAPLVLGALSRKPRWAAAMAFCMLLALALAPAAYWLSFSEGRWAGDPRPTSFAEWTTWMAGERPQLPEKNPDYAATANGVVFGLFPDRLKLADETIVGEKTLEETKKEIASRGGDYIPTRKLDFRDLQAADFSGADLRGVSLSEATMRGAKLASARLDGARVACDPPLYWCAQLQGANLLGARLRGANLLGAGLQGANLVRAQLQGADLVGSRLQGANLQAAQLQGAQIDGARLQGADLRGAQLQGANLRDAQLQGANLYRAQLQGADLSGAQLQGADLSKANQTDSDLSGAFVFRTNMAEVDLSNSAIRSIRADQVKLGDTHIEPLRVPDVDAWIAAATQFAKGGRATQLGADKAMEGTRQQFARLRLEPNFHTPAEDAADEAEWSDLTKQSVTSDPDGARHREQLAAFLGDLACGPDGAPYVARALVTAKTTTLSGYVDRLGVLGNQLAVVRDRMEEGRKTPEKCPGVAGFTEDNWHKLEAIKPN